MNARTEDRISSLLSDRILSRKGIRSIVEVERDSLPLVEFDLENPCDARFARALNVGRLAVDV